MRHQQNSESKIRALEPKDFQAALEEEGDSDDVIVLDTRNYYESKIGYFENAICPPIRNFKSLPAYLEKVTIYILQPAYLGKTTEC